MSELRVSRRGLALLSTLGLAVALTACGGPGSPGDTIDPMVRVTSGATSDSASYELAGVVFDNVGVEAMAYSLGGADEQPLVFADGDFSVNLTLAPGANDITVNATDAAGNVGSDSLTVTYEAPPSDAASAVDIAARGDSVTVTGSNFGDSGSVSVGGKDASVAAWNASEITFTVPADAPGGPQVVTVESAAGSTTFELFVGVDFAAGSLEDLAALGLPPGTAVRLGAGTFDQSSPEVILDNLSLYGRGADETIIDTGISPQMLVILASGGNEVVLDNLELQTDMTVVSSSDPVSVGGADMAGLDAVALLTEAAAGLDSLGSQAVDLTDVTFSNLAIEENAGGMGVLTVNLGTGSIYQGSLNLQNVQYDAAASALALLLNGNLNIEDSSIDVGGSIMASVAGDVSVTATDIEISGTATLGTAGIMYGRELSVTDTVVESYADSIFFLAPLSLALGGGGSPLVTSGPATVTDSTFRMFNPDPATMSSAGTLALAGGNGLSTFSGNTFVANAAFAVVAFAGNVDVDGNDMLVGHAALGHSPIMIQQASEMASFIDFRNNDVSWVALGGVIMADPTGVSIDNNTFSGAGQALGITESSAYRDFDATISGNTFTGFEAALSLGLDGTLGAEGHITVTGNDFDFTMDALGEVASLDDVVNVEVNLDGNRWGGETDLVALNALIERLGATPADKGEITSVLP